MLRVLKKGGLLYLNFIWEKALSTYASTGEERKPGEFWMKEAGEEVVHSIFSEQEVDRFFKGVEILYKQKRHITLRRGDRILKDAYLDYIVRK